MNSFLRKTLPLANIDVGLLLLRITVAGFMLSHGYPKLMTLISGEPVSFANFMGLGPELSLLLAVFAEFLCAVLIVFGLFTRLAAIPLVITMAVAAFHIHADDPFSTKEKALLFLIVFIFLLITGGGRYSIDYILYNKTEKRQRRYI